MPPLRPAANPLTWLGANRLSVTVTERPLPIVPLSASAWAETM